MQGRDELTKKQRKYIREMVAALDTLLAAFQKWKQGGMTPFDLDEEIHQYHNGTARELYKLYTGSHPDLAVLIALKKRIVKIEELNEDCRPFFQDRLDRLRDR